MASLRALVEFRKISDKTHPADNQPTEADKPTEAEKAPPGTT